MNELCGKYQGMDRFECRKAIWADMKEAGLVIKEEPYQMSIPHSQRSGEVIEPMISQQWFVKMESLAKPALEAVRSGSQPELTTRQKHRRECWVVAEDGADLAAIEKAIVTMPNYFDEYDTTVTFITEEELQRDHAGLPHGGFVIRTGTTGVNGEHTHTIEYRLTLDSNPEFTGSVLAALARAVDRIHRRGRTGCLTVFDVAPADLSPLSGEELRAHLL